MDLLRNSSIGCKAIDLRNVLSKRDHSHLKPDFAKQLGELKAIISSSDLCLENCLTSANQDGNIPKHDPKDEMAAEEEFNNLTLRLAQLFEYNKRLREEYLANKEKLKAQSSQSESTDASLRTSSNMLNEKNRLLRSLRGKNNEYERANSYIEEELAKQKKEAKERFKEDIDKVVEVATQTIAKAKESKEGQSSISHIEDLKSVIMSNRNSINLLTDEIDHSDRKLAQLKQKEGLKLNPMEFDEIKAQEQYRVEELGRTRKELIIHIEQERMSIVQKEKQREVKTKDKADLEKELKRLQGKKDYLKGENERFQRNIEAKTLIKECLQEEIEELRGENRQLEEKKDSHEHKAFTLV